jgi:hypothetical protein
MKKRTIFTIALFSLIVIISGVVLMFYFSGSGSPLDPPNRRILGSWTTSIVLSELGPAVTFVTFKEDGSYKWSFYLLYLGTSETGTYNLSEDKLTLSSPGQEVKITFLFKKNKLIITEENGYQYHFRKILKLQ